MRVFLHTRVSTELFKGLIFSFDDKICNCYVIGMSTAVFKTLVDLNYSFLFLPAFEKL